MAAKGNATSTAPEEGEPASGGRFTVAEIMAAEDTQPKEVGVPEWGDKTLLVRGLTKQQQSDIRRKSRVDDEVDETLVAKAMFREGVVEPQFTDAQINALWEKSAGVIDGILMTIIRMSGMDQEAIKRWERLFRN